MTTEEPTKYQWSAQSAARKLTADVKVTISTPTPVVSLSKSFDLTKKDAYLNCKNCQRHYNYHKNGQCPPRSKL